MYSLIGTLVNWLKRPIKMEFFGLCSVPFMTWVINLCAPCIIPILHPFGFLIKRSKHDTFGNESGDLLIFLKNFRYDRHQKERQRQRISSEDTSVFLLASASAPRGWHPRVMCLADHGDNLLSLELLSDRGDWRLEETVLPVWSEWSLHRSVSVPVPPLQYEYHILHTSTERSCSSFHR